MNYDNRERERVSYQLLDDGTFVIGNYNQSRPFSSFFPGIAGLKGIPLWVFYVNRNQGIASFGVNSKNYSLMEFYPANTAYGLAATLGFRTFVKLKTDSSVEFYEPFANKAGSRITQRMFIRAHELLFEEINEEKGLKITVRYFTLPQESLAALVRTVEFENIGSGPLSMEVVDGLPKLIPYWMSADILKSMSYTAQAWTTVTNFAATGIPFYRLKVEISDSPEVVELRKGNFYVGLLRSGEEIRKTGIIIDPEVVFGQDKSFIYPRAFMDQSSFEYPREQVGDNKYPAAMSFFTLSLAPGEKRMLYSVAGHIGSEEKLNEYFEKIKTRDYFEAKAEENKRIIDELTRAVHTESNVKEFDLYCRQTYLDNLLRGGTPIMLPAGGRKTAYYIYSRKHGDLERDYNYFQLSPSYYSQGNGNYRDTNQNKRNDIFFNPQIGDFNILSFYSLIQLDGYNPLVVKGSLFSFNLHSGKARDIISEVVDRKYIDPLKKLLSRHFEPGGLILDVEDQGIKLKVPEEEFLPRILKNSERIEEAEHGEGFWTDHWTYNLDLIESYLSVYPEKEREILLEKREFLFYDNAHVVVPRARKYVHVNGTVRQFGAVAVNMEKGKLIRSRTKLFHAVRDRKGKGEIYKTTLIVKMICLLLNKLSTLDPDGIGIEMEADKPSWYDALNGLPGIFGSSVCETFELKRMVQFLQTHLSALRVGADYRLALPEEMHRFFSGLDKLLSEKEKLSAFSFWDRATTLKEKYRQETLFGVTGKEKPVTCGQLNDFLQRAIAKIDEGLVRAKDKKTGLYFTYFSYEAQDYKRTKECNSKGVPCVAVRKFRRRPLPLFLEAEVHYIKTEKNIEKVRELYRLIKESDLYDRNLKMYKVNASLSRESTDIGRCRVFSPGWLENESIWLHMEYKYLLELLKAELYEEFFTEFRAVGICFQNPKVYGRSILENSSFLASSAFHDEHLWGRGFVARLSGSTAEFIEMWLLMTVGPKPFMVDDNGELTLEFNPALSKEYFTNKNTFTFTFLGSTTVTYHNPQRIDTFSGAAGIKRIIIQWTDGTSDTVGGKTIRGSMALRIRNREARLIEAFF